MKTKGLKIAAVFVLLVLLAILYFKWHGAVNYLDPVSVPVIFDFKVPDRLLPPNSVLVGDYWEKMTMATNSMFQLATIAKVWNATIPIPFTADSYLYGLPTGKINLDAIYDIERLLHLAKQYNINVFSTFVQFINSASRNVIGIEVKYAEKQSQLHARVPHHIYNVDCNKNIDDSLLHQLNSEADKRSLKPFHFVKCCHILAGHDTSPQEISKLCGMHDKGRVTILIKQWRGIEQKARFRLYMKYFRAPYPDPSWIPLPHSKSVIDSSIELLSSKLPSPHMKFIGVHLRSEKVMLRNFNKVIYNQCFKQFYYLAQALSVLYGLPVLYIGDSSTYLVFGKKMSRHKIKLTEYRKTQDEGYKAQVEQTILARAEILVLVGGGSFQLQVYNRYRTYNNTGIVYNVCIDEEKKNYLTPSLRKWKSPHRKH